MWKREWEAPGARAVADGPRVWGGDRTAIGGLGGPPGGGGWGDRMVMLESCVRHCPGPDCSMLLVSQRNAPMAMSLKSFVFSRLSRLKVAACRLAFSIRIPQRGRGGVCPWWSINQLGC